uniref:WASH_WAHD domain-containing protein n=1 Tax=Elaeophora elaphi TaxID=1147741 RepID=A0A0R3S4S8_9BILA
MLEAGSAEPPKEIVENELSTLSNNITSCLSAISLKVGSDKETINCVEECVIAAEELQTLGGLVKTDIRAVSNSVAVINEQIEQLENLFRNIDRLEEFVKQSYNFRPFSLFCTYTEKGAIKPFGKRANESRKTSKKQEEMETRNGKGLTKIAKKGLPDFIEVEESGDDGPMEISSKMQCEMPLIGKTLNSKGKKIKKKIKRRKYKVIKLNESVYKSETKTSTFKVVPLSVPPLEPSCNFRAQLLQKRTKNQRLTKIEQNGLPHKNKWFAATRPARR